MRALLPLRVSAPLRVAWMYWATVSFRPVAGSGVRFRETTLNMGPMGRTTPPAR